MKKLAADDPRHGTQNGYGNFGCRCDRCREAGRQYRLDRDITAYCREWRHSTGRSKPREEWLKEIEPDHGTESRYSSGCRCEACRAASAAARRRRRKSIQNPSRHGLAWVYRHGCRCDECREAWKLRQREIAVSRRKVAA